MSFNSRSVSLSASHLAFISHILSDFTSLLPGPGPAPGSVIPEGFGLSCHLTSAFPLTHLILVWFPSFPGFFEINEILLLSHFPCPNLLALTLSRFGAVNPGLSTLTLA